MTDKTAARCEGDRKVSSLADVVALERLHQFVYLGAGAHFVVGVSSRSTNLAVGQQLAHKALADDDRLERVADGHFAEVKDGALAAPRHQAFGLSRSERDLFAELSEALFVQLDPVHIEANQKLIRLLLRGTF